MKRKIVSVLMIAAMTAVMAAGCGSGGSDSESEDGKTTLAFMNHTGEISSKKPA